MGGSDVRGEEEPAETGGDHRASGATDSVDRAIEAFRAGEPICVHDADDREGETDILYPATAVDPDALAQLRNDAGGLVCVALAADVADAADLPYYVDAVEHPATMTGATAYGDRPSFSLTVNHSGTYTGITDEDRALTISELGGFAADVADGALGGGDGTLADPTDAFAEEFRVPGHVHLLRAAPELLDERRGHTEFAVALAEEAGIPPAVVVCEMLDDASGEELSVAGAREYADRHDIPFLEGEDVVGALQRDTERR
ncbi:3,4-dihydroxy-2-butanone 4-phosphate synthase [Salinarchaeum sp. Harcht-Bsk1]|uniref:3,4-dihydroxy-2-butanone-4-phosphate synthase n=1 Tax=Salinarchaeum sp. Harcht-Bsk1 TaxID=1333523 RepID=UPI000342468D|nr:3,4-dihydroxy-2-butanone-4-phosphate synthase [Salinarchaeum sp. Harcht-Bsk1]AGN01509.1 3,4-dihydroxy-2-butanone 4-phosphate synthase [Salinarchaeum sp. Harcht-Bsk1]